MTLAGLFPAQTLHLGLSLLLAFSGKPEYSGTSLRTQKCQFSIVEDVQPHGTVGRLFLHEKTLDRVDSAPKPPNRGLRTGRFQSHLTQRFDAAMELQQSRTRPDRGS